MMGHAAVIGAGAWGTALAKVLADQGERVTLWTWQEEHARAMQRDRENKEFFAGFPLALSIEPTSDMNAALSGADLVVLVVPSHAFRDTLERARPYVDPGSILVSATKGIENDTLMLMGEVIADVLGAATHARSTYLSGPS